VASGAGASEVATPVMRSPSLSPRTRMNSAAVLPVPRPISMPPSTNPAAYRAGASFPYCAPSTAMTGSGLIKERLRSWRGTAGPPPAAAAGRGVWRQRPMSMATIHVLGDPRTDEIRYVGSTRATLARRLRGHLREYRTAQGALSPRLAWIAELAGEGLQPEIRGLYTMAPCGRAAHVRCVRVSGAAPVLIAGLALTLHHARCL
jgi:hypothetical protein